MDRHKIFRLTAQSDSAAIAALDATGAIFTRRDEIELQLENLARIRTPERGRFADRADVIAEIVGDTPLDQYGVWVYYPWSGHLVHILDEPEFIEVRTAANRNKITPQEQARFADKTVGVLGLSVGNSIALTMALERTFGTIKLADFDELDISNLNRLRATVADLGVNKAELAARQIAELDPYLTVMVYEDGVDDLSIDAFFDDAPGLDLLVEECDMPFVKILAREHARTRGIPVLTEASDRGLLEIERFDLDPAYPLLGGLLGELSTELLEDADRDMQLAAMATMIGIDTISDRSAISAIELDTTLTTWPQLGSEVNHGGAVVASAARAIFLGHEVPSGRRHVDIPFGIAMAPLPDALPTIGPPALPGTPDLTAVPTDIREILELAMRAPSGGNTQPWRFVLTGRVIDVAFAPETFSVPPLFNRKGTAGWVTLGTVTESIVVAARARNLSATVEYDPEGPDSLVYTRITIGDTGPRASAQERALGAALGTRCTQRTREQGRPLTDDERALLRGVVEDFTTTVWLGEDGKLKEAFGEGVAVANRLRVLIEEMNEETFSEFYFRQEEPRRRDGVPLETLGMTLPEQTMMRVLRRPAVARALRERGEATALLEYSREWIAKSSAVGAITVNTEARREFVEAGRAFLRLWLAASSIGVGVHPVTALLHETEMLAFPEGDLFTEDERGTLQTHTGALRDLLLDGNDAPLAVTFRIVAGPAMPEVEPAPRRPLSQHLEIVGEPA
ncbi:Rv1355c family protein [Nocardia tengchongensis]|uniref:Rv1355c family protein n=1 Tax=Nocardia tengchongensis TaxID=2055889 RepID=UPI0036914338